MDFDQKDFLKNVKKTEKNFSHKFSRKYEYVFGEKSGILLILWLLVEKMSRSNFQGAFFLPLLLALLY